MPKNNTVIAAPRDVRGTRTHDRPDLPASSISPEVEQDRSADTLPAIRDAEDLGRVTSDDKPQGGRGLSREAQQQIAPKLNKGTRKKAA